MKEKYEEKILELKEELESKKESGGVEKANVFEEVMSRKVSTVYAFVYPYKAAAATTSCSTGELVVQRFRMNLLS